MLIYKKKVLHDLNENKILPFKINYDKSERNLFPLTGCS